MTDEGNYACRVNTTSHPVILSANARLYVESKSESSSLSKESVFAVPGPCFPSSWFHRQFFYKGAIEVARLCLVPDFGWNGGHWMANGYVVLLFILAIHIWFFHNAVWCWPLIFGYFLMAVWCCCLFYSFMNHNATCFWLFPNGYLLWLFI